MVFDRSDECLGGAARFLPTFLPPDGSFYTKAFTQGQRRMEEKVIGLSRAVVIHMSKAGLQLVFHGTTDESVPSILTCGLQKGTFVTSDFEVALHFAVERSKWNGRCPVVLSVLTRHLTRPRKDRSDRFERNLTRTVNIQALL